MPRLTSFLWGEGVTVLAFYGQTKIRTRKSTYGGPPPFPGKWDEVCQRLNEKRADSKALRRGSIPDNATSLRGRLVGGRPVKASREGKVFAKVSASLPEGNGTDPTEAN